MASRYQPAGLDESGIRELRSLEDELGKLVVALAPETPPAALSEQQLARLKDAERRLGVVMVAYEDA